MKKFIAGLCLLIALFFPLDLLHTRRPVLSDPQPGVVVDVMDPSLDQFANDWRVEIARRFPTNTVGVLCHGGTFLDNQWVCLAHPNSNHPFELVDDLVKEEQARYPGRTIVLLCCNPAHLQYLGHPGVFYASGSVWCVPDRSNVDTNPFSLATLSAVVSPFDLLPDSPARVVNRSVSEPTVVGNIFEFNESH